MKKQKSLFRILLACTLFVLLFSGSAQAAKRLFTLKYKTASGTKKVKVYEYTSGNTVTVAAKSSQRSIELLKGSVKVSVSGKTSYFKKHYKSVILKKKIGLKHARTLLYRVRCKDGTLKAFNVQVTPVSVAEVSSINMPNSFTAGSGSLNATIETKGTVKSTCTVRIKNSSGTLVYKKKLGKKKSATYNFTWDGKPSVSVDASALQNGYVKKGTYTLSVTLKYKSGGTKTLSRDVSFSVLEKPAQTAQKTGTTYSYKKTNWPWQVYSCGDATMDYVAEVICQSVLRTNMSEIQRAKALFTWMGTHITYQNWGDKSLYKSLPDKIDISSAAAKADMAAYEKAMKGRTIVVQGDNYFRKKSGVKSWLAWAKYALVKQKAECCMIGAGYEILLRHAGLSADMLEHLKIGQSGHHFWNIVKIGGAWYMADADRPIQGNMDYGFFLRGTDFMNATPPYTKDGLNSNKKYQAAFALLSAADCPGR